MSPQSVKGKWQARLDRDFPDGCTVVVDHPGWPEDAKPGFACARPLVLEAIGFDVRLLLLPVEAFAERSWTPLVAGYNVIAQDPLRVELPEVGSKTTYRLSAFLTAELRRLLAEERTSERYAQAERQAAR